jgi:hypothetical protein
MGRAPRREETRCLCCWANEADVSGQKAVRDVVRDDTMKSLSAAAACGKARVPCHRLDPTRPQAPRMIVGFRVRLFDASLGGSWTTLFSRIAFLPSDDMRGPPSREGRIAACPVIELSGARLSQLSDRRNRPGVSPITRRKFSVRRLWLENPAARAISAIERSLSCRSPGSRPACVDRILKGTKPSELPSRPRSSSSLSSTDGKDAPARRAADAHRPPESGEKRIRVGCHIDAKPAVAEALRGRRIGLAEFLERFGLLLILERSSSWLMRASMSYEA